MPIDQREPGGCGRKIASQPCARPRRPPRRPGCRRRPARGVVGRPRFPRRASAPPPSRRDRDPGPGPHGRSRPTRASTSAAGANRPVDGSTSRSDKPYRAARHVAARTRAGLSAGDAPALEPLDQRPAEHGDHHRRLEIGADVGDPDLDGRVLRRQPGVEIDHAVVHGRARLDQLGDAAVIVGLVRERFGRAGSGPLVPEDRPIARVAGVLALPERRVGRQRPQHRQPRLQPVQDHRFPRPGTRSTHARAGRRSVAGGRRCRTRSVIASYRCLAVVADRPGCGSVPSATSRAPCCRADSASRMRQLPQARLDDARSTRSAVIRSRPATPSARPRDHPRTGRAHRARPPRRRPTKRGVGRPDQQKFLFYPERAHRDIVLRRSTSTANGPSCGTIRKCRTTTRTSPRPGSKACSTSSGGWARPPIPTVVLDLIVRGVVEVLDFGAAAINIVEGDTVRVAARRRPARARFAARQHQPAAVLARHLRGRRAVGVAALLQPRARSIDRRPHRQLDAGRARADRTRRLAARRLAARSALRRRRSSRRRAQRRPARQRTPPRRRASAASSSCSPLRRPTRSPTPSSAGSPRPASAPTPAAGSSSSRTARSRPWSAPATARSPSTTTRSSRWSATPASSCATMDDQELTHPDDREIDRELYEDLIAGRRTRFESEKRYVHADGHVVWVRSYVGAVYDFDGARSRHDRRPADRHDHPQARREPPRPPGVARSADRPAQPRDARGRADGGHRRAAADRRALRRPRPVHHDQRQPGPRGRRRPARRGRRTAGGLPVLRRHPRPGRR